MTRTRIMAILNVTPDSFSDGGRLTTVEQAVKAGLRALDAGTDILDIGGESTRPGAESVSIEEEIRRTLPVILALREATQDHIDPPTLSIDTRKPEVAEAAIHAGADIWNDVSALGYSPHSPALAAELGCPVILMHAQGTPEMMQDNPTYGDPVKEVCDWLSARVDAVVAAGVEAENITLDPGIGFGKRQSDNLALLKHLSALRALGYPVLLGTSRKSFIGRIDGSTADDRLGGSIASALWGVSQGADILRVHDVSETVQALRVWEGIRNVD